MSTLKLKGSTSGYVELTAPAVSGNNTITLPDTTGTAVVANVNGSVGVGTTNPTSAVTVNGDISLTGHQILTGVGNTRQSVYIGSIETELSPSQYRSPNLHSVIIGAGAGSTVVVSGLGSFSTIVGAYAGERNTGIQNSFYGNAAGQHSGDGSDNNYFGAGAGAGNTGNYNVFLGDFSGAGAGVTNPYYLPTSLYKSNYSVAIGHYAARNGIGSFSTYLGSFVGYSTITSPGVSNILAGYACGFEGISGSQNSIIGSQIGSGATITGNYNTALGFGICYTGSLSGDYNVAVGAGAGNSGVSGSYNSIFGYSAGYEGVTGNYNIIYGNSCSGHGVSGNQNILIGQYISNGPGGANVNGSYNTAVGNNCLWNGVLSGTSNALYGTGCGYTGVSGSYNTLLGNQIGYAYPISSNQNTIIGNTAAFNGVSGANNIAIGDRIVATVGKVGVGLTGIENCLVGVSIATSEGCGGNYNTAVGNYVSWASSISANYNTMLGYLAGKLGVSGDKNTLLGAFIGYNGKITGTENFVGGYGAAQSGLSGNYNTVVGGFAKYGNSAGSQNTYLGYNAGPQEGGSDHVFIGYGAGYWNSVTTQSNNICIGKFSGWSIGQAGIYSNRIVMGNDDHTIAYIKIGWTTWSDIRDKNVIGNVPHGKDFVNALNPIKYQFKNRETGEIKDNKLRYGFSAQDIKELEGDECVVVNDENPDGLSITADHLTPILVNAIKELSQENEDLRKENQQLKDRLDRIEQILNIN